MILDPDQPFVDKAQRLSSWGHWFTFFNILFALLLSARYITTDGLPDTWLGLTFLFTNWLGHTAFITFILFVLTIFPLSLVFPYPRHIRGMAAVIATLGMILLFIDAYSYSRLGYHISGASLEQVVTLLTNTWQDHPVRSFMWVFGISGAIFCYELLISNFTWKRLDRLKEKAWGGNLAFVFLTAFVSSHLIHIWADANLDYDVTQQNNMFPFSYPATAKTLLAKNGLLDRQQHQARQADQLALKQNLEFRPRHQQLQCNIARIDRNLSIVIIDPLDNELHNALNDKGFNRFNKHYVPAMENHAMFDLLYGLPSLYKDSVVANRNQPQWLKLALENNITVELDFANSALFAEYGYLTPEQTFSADHKISVRHLDAQSLPGQLEDLARDQAIIVTRPEANGHALVKVNMWVNWSSLQRYKGQVTQNLDINTTIIESWLGCHGSELVEGLKADVDTFGKNLLIKRPQVLAANYTDGTIVAIKKDKITLLDDQGIDLQLSATNGYKLSQPLDIPALNDTISLLKRYMPADQR